LRTAHARFISQRGSDDSFAHPTSNRDPPAGPGVNGAQPVAPTNVEQAWDAALVSDSDILDDTSTDSPDWDSALF
jgi:hypothetical protein